MGVAIKDILEYDEISIEKLSNKKIAIDTFNMLYQFLASIRQNDGNPLTDSKGNITSHLKGLFNRLVYFKKNNIKAVFVFDGIAPKLKERERELRKEKKVLAEKKYKEAVDMGLMEDARKYASGTTRLESYMVDESKELIKAFGFPIIDAPSEGEAQAAYMTQQGELFAAASQDFDSLLFGSKYLIRNVSVSAKRKIPGTSQYKDVSIEYYDLEKILEKLNISLEELIHIAILCGTDFNPGGIKGIGPKKAIKLIKEYRGREDELYKTLDWHSYFSHTWVDVLNVFRKMPVNKEYTMEYGEMNRGEIKNILTKKDFSEDMVERQLKGVKNIKTLDTFFS
jgi:flap endonuclease-1